MDSTEQMTSTPWVCLGDTVDYNYNNSAECTFYDDHNTVQQQYFKVQIHTVFTQAFLLEKSIFLKIYFQQLLCQLFRHVMSDGWPQLQAVCILWLLLTSFCLCWWSYRYLSQSPVVPVISPSLFSLSGSVVVTSLPSEFVSSPAVILVVAVSHLKTITFR